MRFLPRTVAVYVRTSQSNPSWGKGMWYFQYILSHLKTQADLVIIGAGPAGIATAIAAAGRGLRVLVADARTPPIDKPCGEGLLPEAVKALRALGIPLAPSFGFPIAGIRFVKKSGSVSAEFPGAGGFGVRRVQLHRLLVSRAEKAGVSFLWGERVIDIEPRAITTRTTRIACRWLVGADGQNSNVRKRANLGRRRICSARFGFRRHFGVRPWTNLVEVYWGQNCQIIVTPVGTEEVGVALLSSDPRQRLEHTLPLFPALAEKLRRAAPTSSERGERTCLSSNSAVTRANLALVGDASGTVDAITGQGLSLAFRQALCLAEALEQENLRIYEFGHRKIAATAATMSRCMLLMAGNSCIRRVAFGLLGSFPGLFSSLLSFHTGTNLVPCFGLGSKQRSEHGRKSQF